MNTHGLKPNEPTEHQRRNARAARLEGELIARAAALETIKYVAVNRCDILELIEKKLAFPGLPYAIDCGWICKEGMYYTVTNAGHVIAPQLEKPISFDPDLFPRVWGKVKAHLGGVQ